MLQAVVRGHLVRKHAVGSLRCVQAIIKMQILVRARRTCYSAVEFIDEEKPHVKPGKDNHTKKVHVSSQIDCRILSTLFCRAIKLGTGFHYHNGIMVNIFLLFIKKKMKSRLLVYDYRLHFLNVILLSLDSNSFLLRLGCFSSLLKLILYVSIYIKKCKLNSTISLHNKFKCVSLNCFPGRKKIRSQTRCSVHIH